MKDRIKSGIKEEDWIQSDINENIHRLAYKHAFGDEFSALKPYNKETIRTDNSGRYLGFMGELKTLEYFHSQGIKYSWKNRDPNTKEPSYNFDAKINGYKIEIKTKDRSVSPRLEYEASVAQNSNKKLQECNFYIFTSISRKGHPEKDYSDCEYTLLGYMSKEEFTQKSYLRLQGKVDPTNNFGTPKQCWNIFHDQLHPISELLEILKDK